MDDINEKLDELEEKGDYRGMIELLQKLPNEQRTLELAFTLISALINVGDFRSVIVQLRGIFPLCKEPFELAQIFYYSGYAVAQLGGNYALGFLLLKEARLNDPNEELGLDIEQECRDCVDKMNAELALFKDLCGKAAFLIKKLSSEKKEGPVLSGRELLARLSFLDIFRKVPLLEDPLDINGQDTPVEGEKREELARWVEKTVGVRDLESIKKIFEEVKFYNVSLMVTDALALMHGTPNFDPDVLDHRSRDSLEIFSALVRCFEEFLPSAGVLGWDAAKRTAVVRFAYISGTISEEEYQALTNELLTAVKSLSDPQDFLLSMVFGSALAAFDAQNYSIRAACNALSLTMEQIVKCDLFGCTFAFD